jgi:hypothetical protein
LKMLNCGFWFDGNLNMLVKPLLLKGNELGMVVGIEILRRFVWRKFGVCCWWLRWRSRAKMRKFILLFIFRGKIPLIKKRLLFIKFRCKSKQFTIK